MLATLALPASDWLGWLHEHGEGELSAARQSVTELLALPRGDAGMLPLWNDATTALRNAGALANLLASVHPDEAVIERAEALEVAVRSYETDLYLDPDVYAALASVQPGELDDGAARLLT